MDTQDREDRRKQLGVGGRKRKRDTLNARLVRHRGFRRTGGADAADQAKPGQRSRKWTTPAVAAPQSMSSPASKNHMTQSNNESKIRIKKRLVLTLKAKSPCDFSSTMF